VICSLHPDCRRKAAIGRDCWLSTPKLPHAKAPALPPWLGSGSWSRSWSGSGSRSWSGSGSRSWSGSWSWSWSGSGSGSGSWVGVGVGVVVVVVVGVGVGVGVGVRANMKKGESVFIRTVTTYYTGRVRRLSRSWVVLDDVTNVFQTGPFSAFFERGIASRAERMPDGTSVARSMITDVSPWSHALPLKAST
jgi:hypothetical protein